MKTKESRLVAAGVLGGLAIAALTAATILPTTAQEEGRNTGIPSQEDPAPRASAKAATPVTLFAVVDANGRVSRGFGAERVSRGRYSGDYTVVFDRQITGCAYEATVGLSGRTGVSAPGFITVAGSNSNKAGVFVSTYNLNGVSSARGFHLTVTCG